jgi:hypothetical protein
MKKSSIPSSSPARPERSPQPQVRNKLDPRKNTEQDFKGNDITHNKKATRSAKSKSH